MTVEKLIKELQKLKPKSEIGVGWHIDMAPAGEELRSTSINGVNKTSDDNYLIFIESPQK